MPGIIYKNVKLYRKLVYSEEDSVLSGSAEGILTKIKKIFLQEEKLRILEGGPGGGWISLHIVKQILEILPLKTIEFIAVESDEFMINELKDNLKNLFGSGLSIIEESTAKSIYEVPGCTFYIINEDFAEYIKNSNYKFDLILSFLFLHHLENWKEILRELLEGFLKENGYLIISEIIGDHSAWSYCFDKVSSLDNIDKWRLKYLSLIKKIYDFCKDHGRFNLKSTFASRIDSILKILYENGYVYEKVHHHYDNKIIFRDWLKAIGLFDEKDRVFSVFKKDFEELRKNQKDGGNHTIDQLISRLKPHQDLEVVAKDELVFYVFTRSTNKQIIVNEDLGDLYSHFSELYPLKEKKTPDFNRIISSDIESLISYGIIKNPSIIFPLRWDVKNEDISIDKWDPNIEMYYENSGAYNTALTYNKLTKCLLSGFKVTDYIYRELPQKCIVEFNNTYQGPKDLKDIVELNLERDGSLKKLIFNLNIDKIDIRKYTNRDGFPILSSSPGFGGLLDDHHRLSTKLETEIETFLQEKQQIIDLFVQRFIHYNHIFNRIQSDEEEPWKIERPQDIENICKAVMIAFRIGIKKVSHYPSKDSLEISETTGSFGSKELAAGGYIIYYNDKTKVSESELVTLLNLRNRAIYLKEYQAKATNRIIKQTTKTAIISILVDSFAHNISAHSLAALKWWFQIRAARVASNLKQINHIEEKIQHDPELSEKFLKFIVKISEELDSETRHFNESKAALYTIIQENIESQKYLKWISEFLSQNNSLLIYGEESIVDEDTFTNGNKFDGSCFRFPIPLDRPLYHLMRFLRDKAAFWSGVTRDNPFGGYTKSLYDVIWNDFITNTLYLGTIAHSEGINRLNLIIDISTEIDSENILLKELEFAKIDLSIINEHDVAEPTMHESNYMFLVEGENYSAAKNILEKISIFFPGSIVGEHALFTIFENTIRNIKHYKFEKEWPDIMETGLNLRISIEDAFIADDRSFESQLVCISVSLDHQCSLVSKKSDTKHRKFQELNIETTRSIIDRRTNLPRMGGNTQDKICAAMLIKGTFASAESEFESELFCRKGSEQVANQSWIAFMENILDKKKEIGYLSKSFFLWKSANIRTACSQGIHPKDFSNRYKFVLAKTENELRSLRLSGILRAMLSDVSDVSDAQYNWIKKICGSNYCIRIQMLGEGSNIINNGLFIIDSELRYIGAKHIEDCNYIEQYKCSNIPFAHKFPTDKTIRVRSHGAIAEKILPPKYDIEDFIWGTIPTKDIESKNNSLFDFIETVCTEVVIFDDRMHDRISYSMSNEKMEVLFSSLNFSISLENSDSLDIVLSNSSNIHFLVVHFTFIEGLVDNINEFIERYILEKRSHDSANVVLVVTTGRGKDVFWTKLDERYKDFVTFRPPEILLSAIEDGLMIKDDFNIKYNLCKALYGS